MTALADTDRVRCDRCGRPLTARRSVARGIGPACLRLLAAVAPTREEGGPRIQAGTRAAA